jgi:cytidylate kinase
MPAVTISAGYGTGGSAIARAVAERLGYPLLDRAISSQVAQQLQVSPDEAREGEMKRSFIERFFGVLAPQIDGAIIDPSEDGVYSAIPAVQAAQFRERAEAIVRQALPGGVVVLGRAGAAMLCDAPDVLRVRLFGPEQARITHAAAAEGIDEQAAAKRLPDVDRARAHYVKRLYERDIDDPALYHLQLDSTAIPTDLCVEAVVGVYAGFGAPARPRPRPTPSG